MRDCFSFRLAGGESEGRESLVLFFPGDVPVDVVVKLTKVDVEKNLVPERIYLIAPVNRNGQVDDLLEDASLVSEIDSFVGDPSQKIAHLSFDGNGVIRDVKKNSPVLGDFRLRLLSAGMLAIFEARKGLIVASSNFHFLKPSGDHCDSFIRASNLLIAGEEVAFLALALLPFLHSEIRTIYVDTSSISYLVSTAILMSGKYREKFPVIESFESYAAFNKSFDFIENPTSLVLISATTSGSLAEKLARRTSFQRDQIVTLFYSRLQVGQVGIYDISPSANSYINSYKPESCELCNEGSRLIRIVGDQFLPETPTNDQLLIRKIDFVKDREMFFDEFAAKGVLKWSVLPDSTSSSTEHFYIDVAGFLEKPSVKFSSALKSKLNKHFSRHIKTVLYLNDAGSVALVGKIREAIGDDESIRWLPLDRVQTVDISEEYSVMVVAGAITSGRKLLDASRRLRVLEKGTSITYLVGFSKLPFERDLDQLKRDLEMGGHQVIVLRNCPMPRITAQTRTVWDVELEELKKWDPDNPFCKGELPEILLSRLSALKNSAAETGQLFLPSLNGSPLALRQTFAFWSGIAAATENATQADVYWTIQAILHDLRAKVDGGLGSIYHTTVISPTCFDRYNDGVIQAALLRSATSLELNYSIDETYSRKMTDVINSVLENCQNDQGEAALEFLFALSIRKLKLCNNHLLEIVQRFDVGHANGDVKFYFQRIRESYALS